MTPQTMVNCTHSTTRQRRGQMGALSPTADRNTTMAHTQPQGATLARPRFWNCLTCGRKAVHWFCPQCARADGEISGS